MWWLEDWKDFAYLTSRAWSLIYQMFSCFVLYIIRFTWVKWAQTYNSIYYSNYFKQCKVTKHRRVAQSVTCLATDASLTADPGVASSILARSHTFVDIDHEIISTVFLLLSAESFKRKYVHEVLVYCLFKLAKEKVWLCELTVPPWP